MFGRTGKKKNIRRVRVVYDGQVLCDNVLEELLIREDVILQKSVEFFNDKEPCFIHRSAVISRLQEEIWNALETAEGVTSDYIDFPGSAIIEKG